MPRKTEQLHELADLETMEPLMTATPGKVQRVKPGPRRESFFTIRLSSQELDRLIQLAIERHTKPGTLARELILEGMEQGTQGNLLEARVTAMEQEICQLKKKVRAA